jgi:hypothetical protein
MKQTRLVIRSNLSYDKFYFPRDIFSDISKSVTTFKMRIVDKPDIYLIKDQVRLHFGSGVEMG